MVLLHFCGNFLKLKFIENFLHAESNFSGKLTKELIKIKKKKIKIG